MPVKLVREAAQGGNSKMHDKLHFHCSREIAKRIHWVFDEFESRMDLSSCGIVSFRADTNLVKRGICYAMLCYISEIFSRALTTK